MKIEGIHYQLDWSKFYKGCSIFIPCIDTAAAKDTIAAVTDRLKIDVVMKITVVDGIKGVRVWRV